MAGGEASAGISSGLWGILDISIEDTLSGTPLQLNVRSGCWSGKKYFLNFLVMKTNGICLD